MHILRKSDTNLSFIAFLVLYQSQLNLYLDVQCEWNMKLIFFCEDIDTERPTIKNHIVD